VSSWMSLLTSPSSAPVSPALVVMSNMERVVTSPSSARWPPPASSCWGKRVGARTGCADSTRPPRIPVRTAHYSLPVRQSPDSTNGTQPACVSLIRYRTVPQLVER
jgi:hypothetical protein